MRRRHFLTTSAALSGLALSGCGWRLADVRPTVAETPGRASKKLYIYTWAQYTDDDLLKSFTAQTGIKVVADVFDSNETMLAKLQAGGGRAYSVIYPSDYTVRRMVESNLLTQLDHSRLPGINSFLPPFQNADYDPENRHSIPLSWGTTGFMYNPQRLSATPVDWDYVWTHSKELSKRMTLLNDVREVMGATLRMLGYSYNSENEAQVKQAYEKLRELKPAIAAFNTDAWQNQILTGDLFLAMGYSSDAIHVSKEKNTLKYVIPHSGTSLWTDTMAIPKTAPNPEAAYAWLNFMLDPTVAAEVCERLSFATPNQAAIEKLPPETRNNTDLFPPSSILEKCEHISPLGKFDAVYERYWTLLTSG